jgi:hypothetical protein
MLNLQLNSPIKDSITGPMFPAGVESKVEHILKIYLLRSMLAEPTAGMQGLRKGVAPGNRARLQCDDDGIRFQCSVCRLEWSGHPNRLDHAHAGTTRLFARSVAPVKSSAIQLNSSLLITPSSIIGCRSTWLQPAIQIHDANYFK